jgi:hypothetical protein
MKLICADCHRVGTEQGGEFHRVNIETCRALVCVSCGSPSIHEKAESNQPKIHWSEDALLRLIKDICVPNSGIRIFPQKHRDDTK